MTHLQRPLILLRDALEVRISVPGFLQLNAQPRGNECILIFKFQATCDASSFLNWHAYVSCRCERRHDREQAKDHKRK